MEVTLRGPWKNKDVSQTYEAWGLPPSYDYETVKYSLIHFGNRRIFDLPSDEDIRKYVKKASKHTHAHVAFIALAYLVIFSNLHVVRRFDIVKLLKQSDPVREHPIASREWDEVFRLFNIEKETHEGRVLCRERVPH